MTEVLLIDGLEERGSKLAQLLTKQGKETHHQTSLPGISELRACACLVCTDELIDSHLSQYAEQLPVIVLAEPGSIRAAVSSIKRGAADYLPWPVEAEELVAAIERAAANNILTPQQTLQQFPMIGSSSLMVQLKQNIAKVAPTQSTVLILGQSGTGKELVARAIHAGSSRAAAPLISINCATVPHNLIEAELFGLEQFESPQGTHRGLVDAAEGGTLFLDEVGELPLAAQARLLRVVQGENRRVGSSATHAVDVRVIAATHRNLAQLTTSGQFREDLFYRLNVVCFDLPPLQQRQGDVLEIADWLLQRTANRMNKEGLSFASDATDIMARYHWPGNVRELENAVERAVILSDNNTSISAELLAIEPNTEAGAPPDVAMDPDQTSLEDYFVRFVLDNQDQLTETELAEKLGISRKSLWERRQRLSIPRRKTRKRGPRRDAKADLEDRMD
ncbi:MAG: sigma-54 dependent transcriptional regulator [Pseudomonadota bacterium]